MVRVRPARQPHNLISVAGLNRLCNCRRYDEQYPPESAAYGDTAGDTDTWLRMEIDGICNPYYTGGEGDREC